MTMSPSVGPTNPFRVAAPREAPGGTKDSAAGTMSIGSHYGRRVNKDRRQ